jgi:hypothetical protein
MFGLNLISLKRMVENFRFQFGSLSQYPNTDPFSVDRDSLKISLFSKVVATRLVIAPCPGRPEIILYGSMFSEPRDFDEKVPVFNREQCPKFGDT